MKNKKKILNFRTDTTEAKEWKKLARAAKRPFAQIAREAIRREFSEIREQLARPQGAQSTPREQVNG